jgi:hypothetical protein
MIEQMVDALDVFSVNKHKLLLRDRTELLE